MGKERRTDSVSGAVAQAVDRNLATRVDRKRAFVAGGPVLGPAVVGQYH